MGIKKDRLLRLGNKLLPKKVKQLLVKHNIINDVENVRSLVWDDTQILEFWLTGFNDEGLDVAFSHLYKIYKTILHEDPQWHYFYEGHYSLIRCSYQYYEKVAKYLNDHDINYKYPGQFWTENTYMTREYMHIYKELFHYFSILVMEMYENGDGNHLFLAADRIIHPFFNHALYLAEMDGQLDYYKEMGLIVDNWEVDKMAYLASGRAYHAGKIAGQKELQAYWAKIRKEQED